MGTVKSDNYQSASGTGAVTLGTSGSAKVHTMHGSLKCTGRINSISSADYTITDSDGYDVFLYTTGNSDRTITLPAVANNSGRPLTFIKVDSGTGYVVIDTPGSETINGSAQQKVYTQYGIMRLIPDGTNWYILEANEEGTYTPTFTSNASGVVTSASITLTSNSLVQFKRVGRIVTFSGAMNLNASSGGTADFRVSLPIPSTFDGDGDLAGTVIKATNDSSAFAAGTIFSETSYARILVAIANSGGERVRFCAQYLIA